MKTRNVIGANILLPLLLILSITGDGFAEPAQQGQQGNEQPQDITVELITGARGRIRLAVPDAQVDAAAGASAANARLFTEVLRADLQSSGVFQVQGPEQLSILRLTGNTESDYPMYRSLGNEALIETKIRVDGGRFLAEGRVFVLESGKNVLGKVYRDPTGDTLVRRIAHTFSDEIVKLFSGRRGIALTAIAFHSDRGNSNGREVYLMDYDGFKQRAITAHESLSMAPSWSPEGNAIAYISYYLQGSPAVHLVEMANGKKTPVITNGDLNISPAFSPDGRKIAFARSVGGGNTEIYVANRDGSNLQRLTNARSIDTNPAWSPTGREIAFTSSRSGQPQIYVMSAEGTDLRRVTFTGRYNDGADWSPDGRRIAHSSRRSDNLFDIAITDLITRETLFLTENVPGSHESPTFSPDGRKIAFASNVSSRSNTRTQIYMMDLDGRNWSQLTTAGNNWAPDWSGFLE